MARHALLIATDNYGDARLDALQAPIREAQQLRDLLREPEVGAFNSVNLLPNESKAEVERGIELLFRDAKPGDTVLLYLSCHGIIDPSGQLYFAVRNTQFDLPMSTAVSAMHIHRLVEAYEAAAKIILLDCCYSGAIVRDRAARGGEVVDLKGELLAGRGTYFIAASNAVQPAFEHQSDDPSEPVRSLFTGAILAGLSTGAADLEHDGRITPDELYRYVNREVRQRSSRQNPVADGSVEGEIYVAFARNWPRTRPRVAGLFETPILGDLLPGITSAEPAGLRADGWWGSGRLAVPLGRAYRPGEDGGDPVWVDFSTGSGNLLVVGRLGSGKSVLLSTLVGALALTHSPSEVVMYALEAASNRLGSIRALPHLRGVAGDDEPQRVDALLTAVEELTRARQRLFRTHGIDSLASFRAWRSGAWSPSAPPTAVPAGNGQADGDAPPAGDHADVFLLVDGWQMFASSEEFVRRLRSLASVGPAYGVHLVVTSRWWDVVPTDLAYLLQDHIELRLDEPDTSRIGRETARQLPTDEPGWGLHLGQRFQIAAPRIDRELIIDAAPDGSADLVERVAKAWGSTGHAHPPPVLAPSAPASPWRPEPPLASQDGQLPDPPQPAAALAMPIDLASVLGIADAYQFDPAPAWHQPRSHRDRLRVTIGLGRNGQPVDLDLKESVQDGMGPHGLLIGATGSGKSELLRTVVLGLAVSHSPETLNFMLVDFKGDATFATLDRLPHTSAVITNLVDGLDLVDRVQDSIQGELIRRQELLRKAGNYASQWDYERARAAGSPLAPLPSLLIICDEFGELLTAKPDFIDTFVQIGRIGRSLGVHLLLASQRLEEGRLRGLDSHLSYRIGLRTFSAAESRAALGVADAYQLPNAPGHGYLRFGNETPVRFRAANTSGQARRATTGVEAAGSSAAEGLAKDIVGGSLSDVLVERMADKGPAARRIWLPPLDESPRLDQLLPYLHRSPDRGLTYDAPELHGALRVPVGIVDKPLEQRRDVLWLDLAGAAGHTAIVGAPQSGKSNLVGAFIGGLCLLHTPAEAQIYCLDFGGGALRQLGRLPHVGRIAGRWEVDAVRRIVAQISSLLDQREAAFAAHTIDSMATYRRERPVAGDPYGDVFLVVDGWNTFRNEFEELEEEVANLAERGLSFGIHVVVTTNRWSALRQGFRDLMGTRLELRLGATDESVIDRRAASQVPVNTPGRGLAPDGMHFLAALPRVGEDASDPNSSGGMEWTEDSADAWNGPGAPPVRLLPTMLSVEDLPGPAAQTAPGIPIGIAEDDLAPVYLDFGSEPHLLLFGDVESGKSSFLRALARGVADRATPKQAMIMAIDYRRSLLGSISDKHLLGYGTSAEVTTGMIEDAAEAMRKRLPGPDVTAEQLRSRSWWSGPELYLLIDDYDLVAGPGNNPVAPLLDLIPQGRDIGLHLVIARRMGGAGRAMYDPIISRAREVASAGLLLSGDKSEGALLGNIRPQPLPPGRGWLVTRREGARLVQLAWQKPAD